MVIKNFTVLILSLFILTLCQNVFSQTEKMDKNSSSKSADSGFYQSSTLKSDFNQVEVVAYVNIKERTLIDSMGGDCENNKGAGLCLYRLKADVKEVYKGKVSAKEIEFYTSPDSDYPKEKLMGERVVFLNRSDNYPDKQSGLGTMENSTRFIEFDVLKKMRKIARKKS